MERPSWAPAGTDIERPSTARVYDYHLGGAHNFAADRAFGDQLAAIMPEAPLIVRANRAFLTRAVKFLIKAGIVQFLDLGSGIPTVGNVHELAQRADPDARVVYIDIDPVAVAHGTALLAGNPLAGVVQADLRDVPLVLAHPEVRRLIDFTKPVAVLMLAVLHFVPDRDNPADIVARYLSTVVPGSYLVISHGTPSPDEMVIEGAADAAEAYSRKVSDVTLRRPGQVLPLFGNCRLVEPGLVNLTQWGVEPSEGQAAPTPLPAVAGVARKP